MKILTSASKVVFLMMAITICIGFLTHLLPVDKFMELALLVFGFFFSFKGENNQPYAGK